jgi:hypothetical protein
MYIIISKKTKSFFIWIFCIIEIHLSEREKKRNRINFLHNWLRLSLNNYYYYSHSRNE